MFVCFQPATCMKSLSRSYNQLLSFKQKQAETVNVCVEILIPKWVCRSITPDGCVSRYESVDEAKEQRDKDNKDKAMLAAKEEEAQSRHGSFRRLPSSKEAHMERIGKDLGAEQSDRDSVGKVDAVLLKILARKSVNVLYYAYMMSTSLLGLLSSPFFYAGLMLEYFRMSDGRNVILAVVKGIPNLTRSFLIGMMVVVCFGFYTYAYFSQTAILEDESCHSLFQCVIKHVTDSFRGDITTVVGNIGFAWTFPALVIWQDSWYAWRTVYLMVTLVFWSFLLQPVMNAQIIEAFATLR